MPHLSFRRHRRTMLCHQVEVVFLANVMWWMALSGDISVPE